MNTLAHWLYFCLLWLLVACQSSAPESTATAALERSPLPKVDSVQTKKLFVSTLGGFSIDFPGTPELHEHRTEIEIGAIELHQYIYQEDNLKAWLISYADYPSKMIELGSSNQLLKGIKHRFMKELKANPTTETQFTLEQKYPGFSFVAYSKTNQLDVLYRTFLVENRVFQISMYSSVGPISSKDSSAFVGSFQLLTTQDSL
jgi:hypothetical protein